MPVGEHTTGDASVSPYPSSSFTPYLASTTLATSAGNLAAPDTPWRTVASESGSTPGIPANEAHIVGGPAMVVTRCFWMDSMAETGSNRSISTTLDPVTSARPSTTLSP